MWRHGGRHVGMWAGMATSQLTGHMRRVRADETAAGTLPKNSGHALELYFERQLSRLGLRGTCACGVNGVPKRA
jgi:hypothetical protein